MIWMSDLNQILWIVCGSIQDKARAGQAKAELLSWNQQEVLQKLIGQPVLFKLLQSLDQWVIKWPRTEKSFPFQ